MTEAQYTEPHAETASAHYQMGSILAARDAQSEALAAFERAVDLGTKALAPNTAFVIEARAALGSTLRDLGRVTEARDHLSATRTLAAGNPDIPPRVRTTLLLAYARAQWDAAPEDRSEARAAVVEAEQVLADEQDSAEVDALREAIRDWHHTHDG